MRRVEEKIIIDDKFSHLRSQIVMSNDSKNLNSQFATLSPYGMRREPYTSAKLYLGFAHNNSPEFEGIESQGRLSGFTLVPKQWIEKSQQIVGQISSQALLHSEKSIAKQAAAQFEKKSGNKLLPNLHKFHGNTNGAEE